jgi:hypothetical protein
VVVLFVVALGTLQIWRDPGYSVRRTRQWNSHPVYITKLSWLQCSEFLKATVGADSKVASGRPHQFHRLTGLHCDCYPKTHSQEAMVRYLLQYDYVIDAGCAEDRAYLRPVIRKTPGLFTRCAEFGGPDSVVVYRTARPSSGGPMSWAGRL